MPPRRCLECGVLVRGASRCPAHRRAQRAKYAGDWPERARRAITAYRLTHGDVCPGWGRRPPHPIAAGDWTCDHEVGPLCRSCNTSKMRRGGG